MTINLAIKLLSLAVGRIFTISAGRCWLPSSVNILSVQVQTFPPSSAISHLVANYMFIDINWNHQPLESRVWRLIPHGQTSMLFQFGDMHRYSLQGATVGMQRTSRAFVVGQMRQPLWLHFTGHTRLLKIQFTPSGMRRLLPLDLYEFTDQASIDLELIWGKAVANFTEAIAMATTDQDRIQLANQFLLSRIQPPAEQIAYIDYTLHQMQQAGGNLAIHQLENKLGISSRHLERLFRRHVGLRPKEAGKLMRLNHAIHYLEKLPNTSLTALAHQAGYFDQSHFNKDFRQLTGLAPSQLAKASAGELLVTGGKCFTSAVHPKPAHQDN